MMLCFLRKRSVKSRFCGLLLASMAFPLMLANSPVAVAAEARPERFSLETIRRHLTNSKASWQAGRTSVSELDSSEQKRLLGAPLSDVRTNGDYGKSTRALEEGLPEKFDWRNMNGLDFVSPVKNQGRCGSCVAFAATSTLETQFNIVTQSLAHAWSFSPQHLFSCGGGSCDTGWFPSTAMDSLIDDGVPEEACFPYKSGALGENLSCRKTCSDSKVRSTKAELRVRSKPILGASIDEVKKALLNGPLMTTMKVFNDFYFYKGGVYRHQKGSIAGGHAVMLVGWSNEDRAWIVRNSWGTDWGEQGDFRIAWDDPSGVGGLFFGMQARKDFSAPVLEGLVDARTIRKPVELSIRGYNVSFLSAALEIRGGGSAALVSKPFGADGKLLFNPGEFADGVYTVQARTVLADGGQRISHARLVYLRNGPASATIKIERMTPNMNVWDKIVPQFVVTSKPVPLAQVRYKIENSKGVIVRVRHTDHTADKVAMSFNPEGLPLGSYVLVAEAVSDEGEVLASDRLPFNIIER
ncbi:MAG: C1 family peptidase [Silvanigrellaceae bacterium]